MTNLSDLPLEQQDAIESEKVRLLGEWQKAVKFFNECAGNKISIAHRLKKIAEPEDSILRRNLRRLVKNKVQATSKPKQKKQAEPTDQKNIVGQHFIREPAPEENKTITLEDGRVVSSSYYWTGK